jgi:hypothetical protein
MKEIIILTIKVYLLTIVIPLSITIFLIFGGILGLNLENGLLDSIKEIWLNYYFTGTISSVNAWKIQIVLFIISFIIVLDEEFS